MRKHLDREIKLDLEILKGLASQETGIEGMKLSRFDKVLGLTRERISRVYRGEPVLVGRECRAHGKDEPEDIQPRPGAPKAHESAQ